MDSRTPPMIDLTRHLARLQDSLSPAGEPVGEPLERIAARQEADRFTARARLIFLGFVLLCAASLAAAILGLF